MTMFSVARTDLNFPVTLLTFDKATPMKLALATFHPFDFSRRVPSHAAH